MISTGELARAWHPADWAERAQIVGRIIAYAQAEGINPAANAHWPGHEEWSDQAATQILLGLPQLEVAK